MRDLVELYREKLNLHNATFTRIEHEEAIVAIVYKVTLSKGEEYILKICPRLADYLCEVFFLNNLADLLPVPKIIQKIEPQPDCYGAILINFIPGILLRTDELTADYANQAGRLLAKIHTNKARGFGDLTCPNDLSQDPTSYFTYKFKEAIAECSQHLPAEILNRCENFYDAHINQLSKADGPCFTHRDFRPGNILINRGKVAGIIDWSSARGSFAEEDFYSLEIGDWTDNLEIKPAFLSGYTSIRDLPDYLTVMPLLLLSKAIATIGFTVKTGTWDKENAKLYRRNKQVLDKILKLK